LVHLHTPCAGIAASARVVIPPTIMPFPDAPAIALGGHFFYPMENQPLVIDPIVLKCLGPVPACVHAYLLALQKEYGPGFWVLAKKVAKDLNISLSTFKRTKHTLVMFGLITSNPTMEKRVLASSFTVVSPDEFDLNSLLKSRKKGK